MAGKIAPPGARGTARFTARFRRILLACLGIYGLIAYSVARRTQEFGIRVALGAAPRDILRSVIGQGAALALAGIGVGLVGALLLARLLESLLFGVTPHDPLTFLLVPLSLATVALFASWIPARRALRIEPGQALRCE
ncbi:MAG: FtsX-like permease family protein [Gemmatimonadota bacterium]